MNLNSKSNFVFAVCQVGAEKALKKEVARDEPGLKFAFSRPGFITFKSESPVGMDFRLKSVFARAFGISFGPLKASIFSDSLAASEDELTHLRQEMERFKAEDPRLAFKLHVWERDFHPRGEEPKGFVIGALARQAEERFRTRFPGLFKPVQESGEVPQTGDRVVDLIVLEADQWWLGAHVNGAFHSPFPGGSTQIVLPEAAPSRAYLKLQETLIWSQAPIRGGDTAIEIGSAPGGASFALLERGLNVIGIDPADMAPVVLRNPRFKHVKQTVGSVLREDLPSTIHWLLLDMNVEPRFTLFAVDRLVTRMKESLLGVVLTIKLNQWEIADQIPSMLEHVRAMGMVRIKAAQLSHHRQEIVVYGLTRKGLARK